MICVCVIFKGVLPKRDHDVAFFLHLEIKMKNYEIFYLNCIYGCIVRHKRNS